MKNIAIFLFPLLILMILPVQSNAQAALDEDPYIWLEEIESTKSLDWVKEENAQSEKYIGSDEDFAGLKDQYTEAFNDEDRIAYPNIVGDYVYNLWQDKTNERGLWRRMPLKSYRNGSTDWETVLDIDALSEKENKKWVFAGASWLAPTNELCLLGLSDGGTDENFIREFNASTKEFVDNGFIFESSKGGVSWINKDKVTVSRNFGEGTLTESGYPRQVKILERGQNLSEVAAIFETDKDHVGVFGYSTFGNSERHVFVYRAITFHTSELYYLDGEEYKKVDYPGDAKVEDFHKNQLILFLQSDWEVNGTIYPIGSLVSFDLTENLSGDFKVSTIYQPTENSSFVSTGGSKDFVTVNTMENVQNKLVNYSFNDGQWEGDLIDTPDFGSINLISSSSQNNEFFFIYSNFITPRTLYHATPDQLTVSKKLKDFFNTDGMVINQYMATSKDGTQVPYFVVHKKDIVLNGKNPTLVYAYGGYGVSLQPSYSYTTGIGWMEKGGVYVVANIRGGGEFGPAWHKDGMLDKKQNSYDDFYAVSEDLISKKITSPEHLGAFGWSNGGLMAGVLFTQRPDLYNAVVVGAPLLDMKRYSKLLAGASWVGEYGDPDNPEDWEYLSKYSPYHNVHKEKSYPEVFFVTSTKDDRVHPGHARKMAAKMKDMGHPYLYYETIEGGHGAASTNDQQAFMWASIYTYLRIKLNADLPEKIKG